MQKNGAGLHTASSCYWDNATDGKLNHVFRDHVAIFFLYYIYNSLYSLSALENLHTKKEFLMLKNAVVILPTGIFAQHIYISFVLDCSHKGVC